MKKLLCFLLAGAIFLSLSGCGSEPEIPDPVQETGTEETAAVEEPEPEQSTDELVRRSAVCIVTGSGQNGAGFAVENGYIVTNYHVLFDSEDDITVFTYDNEEYKASLIGYDYDNDIAVLKTDIILEPVAMGDSGMVAAGDTVTAVGNPNGDLSFAGASGKVLDVDPDLLDIIDKDRRYIFFDGNVVSGFSGGPVYDSDGLVIGVLNSTYVGDLSAYDLDHLSGIIPIGTVKDCIRNITG